MWEALAPTREPENRNTEPGSRCARGLLQTRYRANKSLLTTYETKEWEQNGHMKGEQKGKIGLEGQRLGHVT